MAGEAERTGRVPSASRFAFVMAAGLWLAILAGCASQVPPPGGPEDKEPPVVAVTDPVPGAIGVGEGRISVEFSEYVDRRSLQESAFLSPSAGPLKFDWSGTTVEITVPESLRANTTYILTIGTDLQDTRKNRLEESFTLPFSTGPRIDSCTVSGSVDDPEPAGVMVFAYDVAGGRGDTLDPSAVKPDYLTQTGKDGDFLLRNMREGEYRLMAVRDAFKNLVYDVGTDRYGMAASDVRLGEGSPRGVVGVRFRLASQDTVRPFLSGAKSAGAVSAMLRFSEGVGIPGGAASVSITDTARGASLPVVALSPVDTGSRDYLVVTAPQDSGAVYRVSVAGFSDLKGNPADSAGGRAVFEAGSGRDSLPPVLTLNVARDSATGFLPLDPLRLTFTAPVDTLRFAGGFSLDAADGAAVPGLLRWSGSGNAEFTPAGPFAPGGWYTLRVSLDSLATLTGVRGGDSLFVRRFRIAEERMLAAISGRVAVGDGTASRRGFVVEARNLAGGSGAVLRAGADTSGAFSLGPLPEGRYVLSAFEDRNGNGRHDCGTPRPLEFAEPFGLYPDTLRLRPGWPVEGVKITVGR